MKRLSTILAFILAASVAGAAGYSWQTPHAKVLPTGNLEWAPQPFVFEAGASIRYIDFAGGSDANDGATRATPWKHHPWDANAQGKAKACTGIHTYVFKGGVIYRGALKGAGSGTPENPIRLTRDPGWGAGPAVFYGSTQIRGGWGKATADEAPGMPEPDSLWFIDLGTDYDTDRKSQAKFSSMWQVDGEKTERLHIARDPNYDLSDPNYPAKNWHTWKSYNRRNQTFSSPALKGLGDAGLLDGAVLWTESSFLMGAPHKVTPRSYNPKAGSVQFKSRANFSRVSRGNVHFMIENVAAFLDAPGEYFFALEGPKAGRLYLRPAGGVDPNTVVYEVSQIRFPLWLSDQHDVVVSGLEFRHNDPDDGIYNWPPEVGASPCVRIVGNCRNITVRNCRFFHVAGGVAAFPRPTNTGGPYGVYRKEIGDFADDLMDNIVVSDNDILHVDKIGAIMLKGHSEKTEGAGYGRLGHVEVLRNRVVDVGFHYGEHANSSMPAIGVYLPQTCEIAGNIVDTSWGSGIFTVGGKGSGARNKVPLVRMLVHHNQIDNTMLGCNDYGGLEHFQGGPVYIYNNVTRNCVGTRQLGRELGYSLYLDGGFKCYCFNNIVAGVPKPDDPDYYNHCGYFMVFGFMDQLFNNTIYRFDKGLDGSSGNRSNIGGNLVVDCHRTFIGQNRPGDVSMMGGGDTGEMGSMGIPTMAYFSNVFHGNPTGSPGKNDAFGYVGGVSASGAGRGAEVVTGNTLEELRGALEAQKCRLATIGAMADKMPLADPAAKDYRPAADSAARGRGIRYFVPWSLARVVGEWNFFKSEHLPGVVLGEGFYMTDEYRSRDMYYFIPRNDLAVSDCTPADYVSGPLEDWIDGALSFDGKRAASLSHSDMTRNMEYPKGFTYDGSARETLDMGTNSFLIEVVFRTVPGTTGGTLVSKANESGYTLSVADGGGAMLRLAAGDGAAAATSPTPVNDGDWHHLLAEVDRNAGKATLYVDGKQVAEKALNGLGASSLANTADFLAGEGLTGAIDFLRVCRSTLAESKTDIAELYAWEFNGPFLHDFCGVKREDGKTAGALEWRRE